MPLHPNAPTFVPSEPAGLRLNAPEYVPSPELLREMNKANNARSFNEMMREINTARARNLGPSSRKSRKTRKTRKNRKSRKSRR